MNKNPPTYYAHKPPKNMPLVCDVCGEKGWRLDHNEDDDRWECPNCQEPTEYSYNDE